MKTILMTVISVIAFSLSSYGQFGPGLESGLEGGGQSPYADLRIENLYNQELVPSSFQHPTTFTVSFTVVNDIEAGAVSGYNNVNIRISAPQPNGNWFVANYTLSVPDLNPGSSVSLSRSVQVPHNVGNVRIAVSADSNNDIVEFDEDNNTNIKTGFIYP